MVKPCLLGWTQWEDITKEVVNGAEFWTTSKSHTWIRVRWEDGTKSWEPCEHVHMVLKMATEINECYQAHKDWKDEYELHWPKK